MNENPISIKVNYKRVCFNARNYRLLVKMNILPTKRKTGGCIPAANVMLKRANLAPIRPIYSWFHFIIFTFPFNSSVSEKACSSSFCPSSNFFQYKNKNWIRSRPMEIHDELAFCHTWFNPQSSFCRWTKFDQMSIANAEFFFFNHFWHSFRIK